MAISSALESLWSRIFKTKNTTRVIIQQTQDTPTEDRTGDRQVNVRLTRQLYNNSNNLYALSAHLVKPIINSNVSFIYRPTITSTNRLTNTLLSELSIPFYEVHRMAERDGDCFVWPQYNVETGLIDFVILSPNTLYKILRDRNQRIIGYIFRKDRIYYNEQGNKISDMLTITVTATEIRHQYTGDIQAEEVFTNIMGIIPIFQMSNNRESFENHGHSEIENVEPQLKFYHDQTFEAGAAQKQDGHPKMAINTKDPRSWVDNNYGEGMFDALRRGEAKLSLENKDLFINGEGEDVKYVVASRTTGDYAVVSKRTFTNIVEGSETPEIVFGANMGTSLASVKEQRPVWIKKIEMKQEMYSEVWRHILDYTLLLLGTVNFRRVSLDYQMVWPKPDFKSDQEKAEILDTLADVITKLKEANQISDREAFDTLKQYPELRLTDNYEEHFSQVEESVDNDESRLRGKLNTNNNQSDTEDNTQEDQTQGDEDESNE